MTRRYFSSTAIDNTTSGSVDQTVTQFAMTSALAGWPAQYPFTLVIEPDTTNEEVCMVTGAPSGLVYPVTRGVDGSTAKIHASGVAVSHRASAQDFNEPNAHVNATAGVHGLAPGDTVVGQSTISGKATDANVVHNTGNETVAGVKTFSSAPVVPTSSFPEAAVTGLVADLASKVDLTSVQTLSSKTLTSPVITGTITLPTGQILLQPTIADFTNADHDHSTTAKGGFIPETSITNLTQDLAARLEQAGSVGAIAGSGFSSGQQPLVQFGTSIVTTNSTGFFSTSFPTTFPNGLTSLVMSNGDSVAANYVEITGATTSGFNGRAWKFSTSLTAATLAAIVSGTVRVNWIAIGW